MKWSALVIRARIRYRNTRKS